MSAGKILLLVLGFFVALAVVLGLAVSGIYNRLVTLQQGTDAAWAQVQNVYQRRADLIPNLVNTVSGAANFEKSTLAEIVDARASVGRVQLPAGNAPVDPAQFKQFEEAQGRLGSALSRLLVVVEKYPELKSDRNFLQLQDELAGTENRLAVARNRYNDAVREYNTTAKRFPTLVIARLFGFEQKTYFDAPESAREAPNVQF